jgi:hypothetical protein
MLKKRNIGYASTCNTIGQTVGYFEAFVRAIWLLLADFGFIPSLVRLLERVRVG